MSHPTSLAAVRRPGHAGAGHPPGGGGAPVEWYQAGGAQFAAADYSYPAADGGPSSGAYGSFEDEPPLLEGVTPWRPLPLLYRKRSPTLPHCWRACVYLCLNEQGAMSVASMGAEPVSTQLISCSPWTIDYAVACRPYFVMGNPRAPCTQAGIAQRADAVYLAAQSWASTCRPSCGAHCPS